MNFARLVPPDTFIGQYMQAASGLETARSYDFWTAMWALGSCVGRGVVVPRPHAPVFMNWYVMLVAESGVTRKSTAIRLARDTVSSVLGPERMIEGRSTPEYLFDVLTAQPHMAIAVSELVTFLGRESYIIELPALLTDLYDCPPERRGGSITKGERVIRNAFVTFVSASTPSWLRTSVNPTVVEGGFTSRCLFIHDERPKHKVAWPSDEGMDVTRVIALLRQAVYLAQHTQRIELQPAAMRRFETWYRQRDTSSVAPFVASFNSREDAHVLRAAACLAINDATMAIERRHIDTAVKLIAHAKVGAIGVFQDNRAVSRIAQGIDRVIERLIDAGPIGIQHTRLYMAVRYYMPRDDFRILIDLMHESGMLVIAEEHGKRTGPRQRRYVRTDGIMSQAKLAALREAFY